MFPGLVTLIDLFKEWVAGLLVNADPFLAALLTCCILSAGMKNVYAGTEAAAYLSGKLTLTRKQDQYTHTTTTRTKIESKEKSKV